MYICIYINILFVYLCMYLCMNYAQIIDGYNLRENILYKWLYVNYLCLSLKISECEVGYRSLTLGAIIISALVIHDG